MAKPRKKKAPAKNIRARHLTRAIQYSAQRMLYVGSSNRKLSACFKNTLRLQIRYNPKDGDKDYVLAATTMLDELRFFEREWYAWLGCFYENDKERWVETLILKIPEHTLTDIATNTDGIFKEGIKECGEANLVGYAYAITPSDYYDLEAMSDGLCDMFVDNDIFDVSTHLPAAERVVGEYGLAEAVFGNHTLIRYVSQLVAVENKMKLMEDTTGKVQRRDLVENEKERRIKHAALQTSNSESGEVRALPPAVHSGSDEHTGDRAGDSEVVHNSLQSRFDTGVEL